MSLCAECGEHKAAHVDPRSPPLRVGFECLCDACFANAAENLADELTEEAAALGDAARKVRIALAVTKTKRQRRKR